MAEYNTEEVKKYLENYGEMVSYYHELFYGVSAEDSIKKINECISHANNSFPEELKDEKFKEILSGLEKIVKGKPANSD
ncbi:MAG: hypothetical protein NUV46_01255 [Nanoarchaeota archaeon]|nr:hypothetical protein [Nanoarchaeota archaeon]